MVTTLYTVLAIGYSTSINGVYSIDSIPPTVLRLEQKTQASARFYENNKFLAAVPSEATSCELEKSNLKISEINLSKAKSELSLAQETTQKIQEKFENEKQEKLRLEADVGKNLDDMDQLRTKFDQVRKSCNSEKSKLIEKISALQERSHTIIDTLFNT